MRCSCGRKDCFLKNEFRRLAEEGAVKNVESREIVRDPKAAAKAGVWKIGKRRFVKITKNNRRQIQPRRYQLKPM